MTTKKPKPGGSAKRFIGAGWAVQLPYRGASRGSPERVRAAEAKRILRRRGLRRPQVERLVSALERQLTTAGIVDRWPTVRQDAEAIENVAELCKQLADAIHNLSPRASAEVDTAAMQVFRDPLAADRARKPLRLFAAACMVRAAALPSQSHRECYPGVVRLVHQIVGPLGIELTPRARTKFHDVCRAAFMLADLRGREAKKPTGKRPRASIVDPTGSIRAYMDEMKGAEKVVPVIS